MIIYNNDKNKWKKLATDVRFKKVDPFTSSIHNLQTHKLFGKHLKSTV